MRLSKVLNWIIALCGLWEFGDILAIFVPNFGVIQAFVWNHILVGLILIIAGVGAARARNPGTARAMNWLAVGAGLWLIVASFVLGRPEANAGLWNDVVVGIIVVVLGAWAAFTRRQTAG